MNNKSLKKNKVKMNNNQTEQIYMFNYTKKYLSESREKFPFEFLNYKGEIKDDLITFGYIIDTTCPFDNGILDFNIYEYDFEKKEKGELFPFLKFDDLIPFYVKTLKIITKEIERRNKKTEKEREEYKLCMDEDKYDTEGLDTYIICVKHPYCCCDILGIRLRYSNWCKTKEEKELIHPIILDDIPSDR